MSDAKNTDSRRGELRIYLGAAPGVGKTFAMLGEAHRRADRGCDVVAGVVETHGRSRTAEQLDGLEIIEPRLVTYRGATMSELDVDAVLVRRPALVVVDELAHTNTPGSRNEKRWQDVQELLDAGIGVLSTVNVQHLESLNDVVQQITGVAAQETVPDAVVRAAAQVELVDITPEALRRSLSHGNVYAPQKVDAALSNYFRRGNLTALRELALLWLADQVDAALAKYRAENQITDTWEARERVVVAVTGGPESETLVRRASRIASRSSAELMVVHVVRGDGLVGVSAPEMGRVRKLAASVGATMHSVVGDVVPTTLLEFARGANATQLVIGTSRRSRWARVLDEGIGAAVVQQSEKIDVHMVSHEEAGSRHRWSAASPRRRRFVSWAAAVVMPSLASLLLSVLDRAIGINGESAIFFMVVLSVALLGGVAPAALSALISGLLLNYFFTDPRYSFRIAEPDNFLITAVLLAVAVAVAVLVDSAAKRAREARAASQEAELLALFAGSVLRGAKLPALLERLRETYAQRAVSVIHRENGPVSSVGENPPISVDDGDTVADIDEGEYSLVLAGPKLRGRDRRILNAVGNQAVGLIRQQQLTEEASQASALAEADRLRRSLLSAVSHDLRTPLAAVKVAVSSLRSDDVEFSPEDTAELLATVEESTDQLTEEASQASALAEADRLRRSLLSAVSHDLRTPLAAVKVAVSSLRSDDVEFSPEDTAELLATVEESTDQLTALVGNLLDSSRLAAGVVRPTLRRVYLDEVVHRALIGMRRGTGGSFGAVVDGVQIEVAGAAVLADAGLLERVLANLIDNALRYAPESVVRIGAAPAGARMLITVADTGRGLARGTEEKVFGAFQRAGDRDNSTGVGLGLSVVRGFVEAMGGSVSATDTPGGGLTMVVDLANAWPSTAVPDHLGDVADPAVARS